MCGEVEAGGRAQGRFVADCALSGALPQCSRARVRATSAERTRSSLRLVSHSIAQRRADPLAATRSAARPGTRELSAGVTDDAMRSLSARKAKDGKKRGAPFGILARPLTRNLHDEPSERQHGRRI